MDLQAGDGSYKQFQADRSTLAHLKGSRIPPAMHAERLHVTDKGITLITAEMLDQNLHCTR